MHEHDNWFVAQLKPNGLTKALDHLKRQKVRTFAPALMTTRMKAGVHKETRMPLFPGYLFLQFNPAEPGFTAVNSTRGVSRLILQDERRPQPLLRSLIAGLMARCDAAGLLLPPADLEVGERVRVLLGPFAQELTTIKTLSGQDRVGVLFDLMGRKVRANLPRNQVQREEMCHPDQRVVP